MAVITEEGLRGEWFYIEEGQLLDRTGISFYSLRDGEMRTGNGAEVIGTYFIEGNHAVITINRTALMTMEIAMYSTGPTFNGTTGLLEPLLLTRYPMAESSFTFTDHSFAGLRTSRSPTISAHA